jgi:hypothetical protein
VNASRCKWVVITDTRHHPRLLLNANSFLRSVLMEGNAHDPMRHCHQPLVVTNAETKLETVLLGEIQLHARRPDGEGLHPTLALLWTPHDKCLLTGADLLEYLLRGVGDPGTTRGQAS